MTGDGPHSPRRSFVLPETTALVVIGLVDMLTTLFWIARGEAYEANYLFGIILKDYGPLGFIVAKALLLGLPLTVAELARRQNEPFVKMALRVGIFAYLGFYFLSFYRVNVG